MTAVRFPFPSLSTQARQQIGRNTDQIVDFQGLEQNLHSGTPHIVRSAAAQLVVQHGVGNHQELIEEILTRALGKTASPQTRGSAQWALNEIVGYRRFVSGNYSSVRIAK